MISYNYPPPLKKGHFFNLRGYYFQEYGNNSELVNEFSNNDEKKKFQGINLKNNSKIKLKNKILGTEEISNNIGKKISRYRNLKKEIINDFNNSARINYINNITKSKNFIFDSENNKKNKNSDIINLI